MKTGLYRTIEKKSEGLYKEKGSKFIAYAYPVNNEDEIKELISDLKKEHHNARHHCYAYALNPDRNIYRYNDDGEPSSTAGKPIYGQILSYDVTNVLIVVVRYFGGTKLGVGGLINAYKTAAADVLDNSEIVVRSVMNYYKIVFPYILMNDAMRLIKEENLNIKKQSYDNVCEIVIGIPEADTEKVKSRVEKLDGISLDYLYTV